MHGFSKSILSVLLLAYTAYALDCHMCLGSLNGDCLNNPDKATVTQHCANNGYETYCVKMFSKDNAVMTENFQRGCGYINEGLDICEYVLEHQPEVTSCVYCDSDMCNSD